MDKSVHMNAADRLDLLSTLLDNATDRGMKMTPAAASGMAEMLTEIARALQAVESVSLKLKFDVRKRAV